MKKFEFTGETKVVDLFFKKVTLRRIRATMKFGVIKIGDLGGWIENERNLSAEGKSWVYGDAEVYGNAKVYGDAEVYGNAEVCGNAEVYGNAKVYGDAKVCGNAKVYGNAKVCGDAEVCGNAEVCGDAEVYGNAEVCGNAEVYGDAEVYGNAEVCGNAEVYGNAKVCGDAEVCGNAKVYGDAEVFLVSHILVIGPIGSRNAFTTFYRDEDNEITVKCGCFNGKIGKFLERVSQTHGDNHHALVYRAAVELAKVSIDLSEKKEEKEVLDENED